MDIILFFITLFCTFGSLTAVFCLTPYFNLPNTCFGIRVPKDCDKSQKLKNIKKNYIIQSALSGIALAVCAAIIKTYTALFTTLVFYALLSLINYLYCRRTVKSMELVEYDFKEIKVSAKNLPAVPALSFWWQLLLLVFPGFLFVVCYIKKLSYFAPVLSFLVFLAFFAIHFVIYKASLYAGGESFAKDIEKSAKIRRRWSALCIAFSVLLQILAVCLVFLPVGIVSLLVCYAILMIIVVLSIIFGIKK